MDQSTDNDNLTTAAAADEAEAISSAETSDQQKNSDQQPKQSTNSETASSQKACEQVQSSNSNTVTAEQCSSSVEQEKTAEKTEEAKSIKEEVPSPSTTVNKTSDEKELSTEDTAKITQKPTSKPMKNEPRNKVMEDQTALNNLLAAAAAETLGSIATTTARNQPATQYNTVGSSRLMPNIAPMIPINGATMPVNVNGSVTSNLQQQQHFMFGQPQFTTAPAAQPQFFIAGPSQSNGTGLPYQQILIPLNQPPSVQPANMAAQAQGNPMAQQYITIPVSLGMGSAQPIQILANPPIMAGLQQFAMIPSQVGTTPDANTTGTNKITAETVGGTNNSSMITPMFLSAPPGATILSTPQLQAAPSASSTLVQPPQQSDVTTSMADINSQIAKFLPSIQSLVSTTMSGQVLNRDGGVTAGPVGTGIDTQSPGANETLVSSTEPGSVIDGIILDDIKEFAKQFKSRRLAMGLTQTQVGHALSAAEGPAYSQSAICRFEKLDITPKSAQKIKPVLERWLMEAEARHRCGGNSMAGSATSDRSKKRKRRTSFTPQAVEILTEYFLKNTHPSGSEMTVMANKLGYDREVVRVWFCNKRQALKNASKRLKPDTSTTTTSTTADNRSITPLSL